MYCLEIDSENGTISPEASFINMFGLCGGVIGAIYGGLLHSRLQNVRFRESNEATLYYSKKAAHRELVDAMTISFGKGAARFGIKYAIFFTSFAYVASFTLNQSMNLTNFFWKLIEKFERKNLIQSFNLNF